jgi:hypothetical protein
MNLVDDGEIGTIGVKNISRKLQVQVGHLGRTGITNTAHAA